MSVIVRSSSGTEGCPLHHTYGEEFIHVKIINSLTGCPVIVCLLSGEYLLFCKGADSSIFPRVVSGKVEQVKARVEQNAVVSAQFSS